MTANEFKVKKVLCDSSKVVHTIGELENEWLTALLLRAQVSKVMLDKRMKEGTIGNSQWRDYLIKTFQLSITKDLQTKSVHVFKYNFQTEKTVKVAEWSSPEVTKMTRDGKVYYELALKYWQII